MYLRYLPGKRPKVRGETEAIERAALTATSMQAALAECDIPM